MEALVIITILFLVGLATWTGVTAHSNSVTIAKYRRQFEHQKDELRQAALINKRLRVERDALMEMCVKYKRAAEDNKPTQFNKEPDALVSLHWQRNLPVTSIHPSCLLIFLLRRPRFMTFLKMCPILIIFF